MMSFANTSSVQITHEEALTASGKGRIQWLATFRENGGAAKILEFIFYEIVETGGH